MVVMSYLTPVKEIDAVATGFPSMAIATFSFNQVTHNQPPTLRADEPSCFDILLGKHKVIFNHSGNKRYRAIINANLDKYIAARTKSSKTKLIRQVHGDLEKSGYRFLRKHVTTKVWSEIESHEAREKVSHALRDRVREKQKPTKRRRKFQENLLIDLHDLLPSSSISVAAVKEDLEPLPIGLVTPLKVDETANLAKAEPNNPANLFPPSCDNVKQKLPVNESSYESETRKIPEESLSNRLRRISLLSLDGMSIPALLSNDKDGLSNDEEFVPLKSDNSRVQKRLSNDDLSVLGQADRHLSLWSIDGIGVVDHQHQLRLSVSNVDDVIVPLDRAQRRPSMLSTESTLSLEYGDSSDDRVISIHTDEGLSMTMSRRGSMHSIDSIVSDIDDISRPTHYCMNDHNQHYDPIDVAIRKMEVENEYHVQFEKHFEDDFDTMPIAPVDVSTWRAMSTRKFL